MKKFMASFAALAAGFAAQHAEALPGTADAVVVAPNLESTVPGQVASSEVTVTNKAGDAFEFTLERAGNGILMGYHTSHASHSSHSSHYSSRR